ncbi:MAG: carboxypeptidase-like regulatory domain-containing protein [Gemmataceae bacterium]|nr:carboxypeptidase-like regulatory domain-containing protein [Gemmataceae bacterium]
MLMGTGLLSLALLLAGCGKGNGTLSGKVTYKGAILKGGTVTFITSDTKGIARANIEPDGTYNAANVPLGEVKVAVETNSVKPIKLPPQAKGGMFPKDVEVPADAKEKSKSLAPVSDPERYVAIPKQYADPEKSGLKLTVTGGPQQHDIPLK